MSTACEIRPAERRDLPALSALAKAQAAARQALDPRLPAAPHIIPFLSQAETLDDVLSWRHHVTLVARRDGQLIGGINLHRVEQSDRDQFAAYYPRRFTSIGLLAAQADAPAAVVADLLAAAREQAARWKSTALLAHNATADAALRAALEKSGYRMFYHYALRQPVPPGATYSAAPSRSTDMGDDSATASPARLRDAADYDVPAVVPDGSPASLARGPAQPESSSPATPAIALIRQPERGVPVARPVWPAAVQATSFNPVPPASDEIQPASIRAPGKPALEGLSVRQATSADLNAIVALGLESVRYHASLEPAMRVPYGEDGKMRRRFQEILREPQHGALFVAMLDWQIVGFYSLYLQSIDDSWTPPLFAPGRYGLIAEVAVAEGLRGRGIGRLLFQAVEQWFRERGAQRLWLIYLPRNPLSSRFWPSLGFEPVWDVMLAGA